MSKYNVSDEDKEQLFGEIDNQGFEYWLVNYASSSEELKRYPELYEKAIAAAKVIEDIENEFMEADILE